MGQEFGLDTIYSEPLFSSSLKKTNGGSSSGLSGRKINNRTEIICHHIVWKDLVPFCGGVNLSIVKP